jgi:hypothetical protein
MTGPSLDPPLIGRIELGWIGLGWIGLGPNDLNKLLTYITAEMTKRIKMMQQMVYPPAVTVSDVKFRMVMVSTITEMTNNMINSYMYERRT